MRHFVQYHNTKKQGPLTLGERLHVLTKKPAEHLQGATIWLISGEGMTKKDYFLRYFFVTDRIEHSPNPNFKWMLSGTDGQVFTPWRQLTVFDWFKEFMESQQNFRGGIWPMRTTDVENFKAIALAS